jgi:hypothetical protein
MRFLFLGAVLYSSLTGVSAEARVKPDPKKMQEYSKKAVETIAQSEAWDATKRGVKKAKDRLQKDCRNIKGGNHANSTPAVRTCS